MMRKISWSTAAATDNPEVGVMTPTSRAPLSRAVATMRGALSSCHGSAHSAHQLPSSTITTLTTSQDNHNKSPKCLPAGQIAQRRRGQATKLPRYLDAVPTASSSVALVEVDDVVLEKLVRAATEGADADEVTPRQTAGPIWTPTSVRWLRNFHRDRRTGVNAPRATSTLTSCMSATSRWAGP